jgi:DNA-binding protein YbaB
VDSIDTLRARVDEMMAQVRRMTHEMGDTRKKILEVTATARSEDGLVTATVGPRGHLLELEIDPRIYRRPNSALLAQTIVETVRVAVEQAGQEVFQLLDSFAPEGIGPDAVMKSIGMPDDLVRQHDADVLKAREAQDGE